MPAVPRLNAALALLALALPAIPSRADDAMPRLNTRRIELGTEVLETGLAPIKGLRLYVTRDGGRSWGRPIPQPPQGPVVWEAPEDGTYGFTLCGVDAVGNAQRGPTGGEDPQVTLRVDTRPPAISLQAEPPRAGGPLRFSWNARDEDAVAEVRVEASRDEGASWKEAARGAATGEGVLPSVQTPVLLRALARDLAGNRATSRVLSLSPLPAASPEPVRTPEPTPPPAPIHHPPPAPVPAPAPEPEALPEGSEAAVRFAAATLYRLNGKIQKAEAEYRRALEADPRHIQALNDLGILLFRNPERKEEGLLFLERARLLAPSDDDVAFNLGYALLATGHPAEAVSHLKAAAEGLPVGARTEAQRLLTQAQREAP